MTRSRKFLVGVAMVTAVAITGVAVAALIFRLRGNGSSSGLDTNLTYLSANGTSDDELLQADDTGPDPIGPGMTLPARATYDIGHTTLSLSGGELVATIVNSYPGYWPTVHAVASSSSHSIVIQRVVTTGPDAALVTATLGPEFCGDPLNSGSREVDVAFLIGEVESGQDLTFSWDVEVVPAAEYVAGNCNAWSI